MALIPIYCSNESCKHLGFVSAETLPRVLTCSSCGLQSLYAPPRVSAKKDCQFVPRHPPAAEIFLGAA
jgi:hypothetical protein